MSRRSKAVADGVRLAFAIRGGVLTKNARVVTIKQFVNWCWDKGKPILQVRSTSGHHVAGFALYMLERKLDPRTIQTKLGHVRQILRAAGRNGLANDPRLGNVALGVGNVPRKGTNQPISPEALDRVLTCACKRSPELHAGVRLSRALGLRANEIVMCGPSLARWKRDLEAGYMAYVTRGTKGGKHRFVLPCDRAEALAAVIHALGVKGRRKDLFKKPTAKQARKLYANEWTRHLSPASGEGSTPHSLRYAYAQELRAHLLALGFSETEVDSIVGLNLGHGDSRGRYMHLVYGQHPLLGRAG